MTDFGFFSKHPSEEHDDIDFEVFEADEHRFVIDRCISGDGNWGEFFMMSRAKHLGRQFAARACSEEALAVIRSVPADAEMLGRADTAFELELLDKVSTSMLSALCEPDAFTSAATFRGLMKISGSDALFHAFHDQWRQMASPSSAMLLQAAREMEMKFEERYGEYHSTDLARIRAGDTPPQPHR
ncbi:hypothetical protein G6L37_01970 [Agrobacterium rubi]|nr:hypothetical protein [Agrobacterium rubi]NTF24160.1 hypothetical protein [Agrobacterium rubi]